MNAATATAPQTRDMTLACGMRMYGLIPVDGIAPP